MAGSPLQNSSSRQRRRKSFRPSSEINVTPLVDVMLVLLIIFMVTAPMMTVGVPVDLPKTQAAQLNDQIKPMVVSVNEKGETFLQEEELKMPDIIAKLKTELANKPDTRIYVRGDKKLAYGTIMETMGSIAAAGFTHVSLIAEAQNMPTPQSASTHKDEASKASVANANMQKPSQTHTQLKPAR